MQLVGFDVSCYLNVLRWKHMQYCEELGACDRVTSSRKSNTELVGQSLYEFGFRKLNSQLATYSIVAFLQHYIKLNSQHPAAWIFVYTCNFGFGKLNSQLPTSSMFDRVWVLAVLLSIEYPTPSRLYIGLFSFKHFTRCPFVIGYIMPNSQQLHKPAPQTFNIYTQDH